MVDFTDNMFSVAPISIKLTETSGIGKQKNRKKRGNRWRSYFFKCHLSENIAKEEKGFIMIWWWWWF